MVAKVHMLWTRRQGYSEDSPAHPPGAHLAHGGKDVVRLHRDVLQPRPLVLLQVRLDLALAAWVGEVGGRVGRWGLGVGVSGGGGWGGWGGGGGWWGGLLCLCEGRLDGKGYARGERKGLLKAECCGTIARLLAPPHRAGACPALMAHHLRLCPPCAAGVALQGPCE